MSLTDKLKKKAQQALKTAVEAGQEAKNAWDQTDKSELEALGKTAKDALNTGVGQARQLGNEFSHKVKKFIDDDTTSTEQKAQSVETKPQAQSQRTTVPKGNKNKNRKNKKRKGPGKRR